MLQGRHSNIHRKIFKGIPSQLFIISRSVSVVLLANCSLTVT